MAESSIITMATTVIPGDAPTRVKLAMRNQYTKWWFRRNVIKSPNNHTIDSVLYWARWREL